MISKQEEKREADYLKTVLYVLEKQMDKLEADKEQLDGDIREAMKYIWEVGSTEADDWNNSSDSVRALNRGVVTREHSLKAYRRMLASAYFARVDIQTAEETLPVYLGIASLNDGDEFYVYDWRAPICSPFYDSDIGDTSYTLPDGTVIPCKVTLKRQFKIDGDKILEIFDTNMQIVDEVLAKILSTSGSVKMKNIVATIQKEQNRIIRKDDVDVLAVQGPAGSGKTSVALHRIAYLLYADKDNLNKNNMLILSPNETFSDYISDVLPQMGEENVYQTTFYDYVSACLGDFKIKNNMDDLYEELFIGKKTPLYNSIRLKFWPGYIRLIEKHLDNKKFDLFSVANDIVIDGINLASAEFLQRYVSNTYAESTLPIIQQAKLVNDKIVSISSVKLTKNLKVKTKLKKQLSTNMRKIRSKAIYLDLYSNLDRFTADVQGVYNELGTPKQERLTIKELKDVFEYTNDCITKGYISYEDVTPFMYLKERVMGFNEQHAIKHVVIDEAQDYSLVQYQIASNVFKSAKITLLGDLNQSIMPFVNYTSYEPIIKMFLRDRARDKEETQYLTKTYRSTVEINNFARKLMVNQAYYREQVERHGDQVEIIQDHETGEKSKMVQDAVEFKKRFGTVAIIYKTKKECKELQKALAKTKYAKDFLYMIDGECNFSTDKVMVMPLYTAKGLEFDAVLVAGCNEDNYNSETKKLFYVACTRAMNHLSLYYDDIPSSLVL